MIIGLEAKTNNIKHLALQNGLGMFISNMSTDTSSILLRTQYPKIVCVKQQTFVVPEQPWEVTDTTLGAIHRAEEALRLLGSDISIGIENGIWTLFKHPDPNKCLYVDTAVVAAIYNNRMYHTTSEGVIFPAKYVLEAKELIEWGITDVTVGKVISYYLKCDHANPHYALTYGFCDRKNILARALYNLLNQINISL